MCKTRYSTKDELANHVFIKHGATCPICGKFYGAKKGYRLSKHWRIHYDASGDLKEHWKIHYSLSGVLENGTKSSQIGHDKNEDSSSNCGSINSRQDDDREDAIESPSDHSPTPSDHNTEPSLVAEKGAVSMCTLALPSDWNEEDGSRHDQTSVQNSNSVVASCNLDVTSQDVTDNESSSNEVSPIIMLAKETEERPVKPPARVKVNNNISRKRAVPPKFASWLLHSKKPRELALTNHIPFADNSKQQCHTSTSFPQHRNVGIAEPMITQSPSTEIAQPTSPKKLNSEINIITDYDLPKPANDPPKLANSTLYSVNQLHMPSEPNTSRDSIAAMPVEPTCSNVSTRVNINSHQTQIGVPLNILYSAVQNNDNNQPTYYNSTTGTHVCRLCLAVLPKNHYSIKTHFLANHKEYLKFKLTEMRQRQHMAPPPPSHSSIVNPLNAANNFVVQLTCSSCSFQTTDSAQLSKHIANLHPVVSLKSCSKCDYTSLYTHELEKHCRTYHTA